jgi:CheY-like chemotaxis protein
MSEGSLNVLVVTSEDAVANAIASFLRHRGHIVTTAENAREALRLPQPDVLVADLAFGQSELEDGFELVRELRGERSTPRAVLYTESPSVDIFRSAAALGGTRVLLKPIELDRLLESVEDDFDEELYEPEAEEIPRLEAGYTSTTDCIDASARDLAAFALRLGIGPSGRCRIASAVAEMMENARRHAYADKLGTIALTATTRGRTLEVTVHDLGLGFDSGQVVTDALLSGKGGISRASSLAEDLRIESTPGNGTRACLEFSAFPVKFDDEHIVDLSELDYLTPELAKKIVTFLESEEGESPFRLSPALAVTVGRLLAGPETPKVQQDALWS